MQPATHGQQQRLAPGIGLGTGTGPPAPQRRSLLGSTRTEKQQKQTLHVHEGMGMGSARNGVVIGSANGFAAPTTTPGASGSTVPQKRKLGFGIGHGNPQGQGHGLGGSNKARREEDGVRRREGEGMSGKPHSRGGGSSAAAARHGANALGGPARGAANGSSANADTGDEIRCRCGSSMDDGFSIACDVCGRWCHAACFGIAEGSVPEEWRCWVCAPGGASIFLSSFPAFVSFFHCASGFGGRRFDADLLQRRERCLDFLWDVLIGGQRTASLARTDSPLVPPAAASLSAVSLTPSFFLSLPFALAVSAHPLRTVAFYPSPASPHAGEACACRETASPFSSGVGVFRGAGTTASLILCPFMLLSLFRPSMPHRGGHAVSLFDEAVGLPFLFLDNHVLRALVTLDAIYPFSVIGIGDLHLHLYFVNGRTRDISSFFGEGTTSSPILLRPPSLLYL